MIVLDYLTGQDLNNILKQGKKLNLGDCKFIMKETLLALDYIHSKSIIHRDLKPHNIVVDLEERTVKLIDFGLSLQYSKTTRIDKFIRCGTMGYIAPEVISSSSQHRNRYDTKSDMFGFGIIAHMLLMGTNPLRGKTYKETIDKNVKGEINLNQSAIIEKYGKECLDMLTQLLEQDAVKRPSAKEILNHPFLVLETEPHQKSYHLLVCDQE